MSRPSGEGKESEIEQRALGLIYDQRPAWIHRIAVPSFLASDRHEPWPISQHDMRPLSEDG